jgi:hypothetical protein
MVKNILTKAGVVENETFKETRFIKPPKTTYAVFMDAFNRYGADAVNLITEHDYTIELYSYIPDAEAEKRIENSLDYYAIPYEKEPRYWIQEEQLYQVIYTFNFIEK